MDTILVLDDEKEIRNIIQKFLIKKGFQVFTAGSGEEALVIIEKGKPDLFILDKGMPGIGSAGVIRYLEEKNLHIPFIILTGSPAEPDILKDIKGADESDFLFKPVDLGILLEKVKQKLTI